MLTRTSRQTITFENEFSLSGMEQQMWPPGSYVVETEEELITELSFPAYRRTAMVIHLSQPGCPGRYEVATIDPQHLDAAIERDSALKSNSSTRSTS